MDRPEMPADEGMTDEETERMLRERDAYVEDALQEEAKEHDIRWIPPGDEDVEPKG